LWEEVAVVEEEEEVVVEVVVVAVEEEVEVLQEHSIILVLQQANSHPCRFAANMVSWAQVRASSIHPMAFALGQKKIS
jgi:hypothetical protein